MLKAISALNYGKEPVSVPGVWICSQGNYI